MSNAAPLQREDSRDFANSSETVSERIHELAAQGLKPRDISALLGVHPMLVIRVLEPKERGAWSVSEGSSTQGTACGANER